MKQIHPELKIVFYLAEIYHFLINRKTKLNDFNILILIVWVVKLKKQDKYLLRPFFLINSLANYFFNH